MTACERNSGTGSASVAVKPEAVNAGPYRYTNPASRRPRARRWAGENAHMEPPAIT